MTFSLGTLGGEGGARSPADPSPAPRWRTQLGLLIGAVLWLLLVLSLLTHKASDPGFSTSGLGGPVLNRAGALGAWVSDLAYFAFGYSVWWVVLVALRSWLSRLAHALRGHDPGTQRAIWWVWAGLALLLLASCSLEWTRLYRLDAGLPGGQAGGALGQMAGRASMVGLGFAGSGVLWIAALVTGLSLAFRFSWPSVAESLGRGGS